MRRLLYMVLLCIPILSFAQNSRVEAVRANYEQKLNEYQRDLQQKKNRLKEEERKGPGQENEFSWNLWIKDLRLDVALAEKNITMLNDWYQKAIKRASEEDAVEQSKKTEQQRMQRQQKSQNRQTQRNAGQSATAAQNEKEEAARKAKEDAARKAKEEQARKAQFDSNKQKAMQTSESYYNTQRAYVEHTASSQAFAQVSAKVSNNQVQRTLSNVPSGKSGKQMPGNSTFNKLQQRNRGEAVNGVYLVNHQESTILFEQRLAVRTAAVERRYDKNWSLEQKKEALSIWLGPDTKMQKLSENAAKKRFENDVKNTIKTEASNARRGEILFKNAKTQPEKDKASQKQYADVVPDQGYKEPHFLSQLDASEQSWIIDVLVEKCKDSHGLVNSDMLKRIVDKVDYAHWKNVEIIEGSDDVTGRANEVLAALRELCSQEGFCNENKSR